MSPFQGSYFSSAGLVGSPGTKLFAYVGLVIHYDAVGLILVPPPASKYRSIPKCAAYSATTYDRYIYPSYHSTDDQHHFFLLSVPELGLVGRRHQDRGLKPTSPSTLYASNRRHSLFCVVSRNQ